MDTRVEDDSGGHEVHPDEQEHEEPLAEASGKAPWRRRCVQFGVGARTLGVEEVICPVVKDGQELIEVVEAVGADATGGGSEVARDAEGVALAEEVGKGDDDRHQPRDEYDPTSAGLGRKGLGVQRQNDRHEPRKQTQQQQTLISYKYSDFELLCSVGLRHGFSSGLTFSTTTSLQATIDKYL